MHDTDQRYQRILQLVRSTPWAILPEKLAVIMEVLTLRAAGQRFTDEEIKQRLGAAETTATRGASSGVVAVIPLVGTIIPRADAFEEMSGATSMQRFVARFRSALNDAAVRAVVIDIDSPGGMVNGVPEAADEIFKARSGAKKVVAVANHEAASAAYWLGAAAEEFVISPSAEAGSIGVWTAHVDASKYFEEKVGIKHTLISAGKYKVEGHPFGPLEDEARAYLQTRVNETYDDFVSAVAKFRGKKPSEVREGFGEGRMVGAREADSIGLVDRIGTLDETIARMQGRAGAPRSSRSAHQFTF